MINNVTIRETTAMRMNISFFIEDISFNVHLSQSLGKCLESVKEFANALLHFSHLFNLLKSFHLLLFHIIIPFS